LWSDGGPARAFQFYEVADSMVRELVCSGYLPDSPAPGLTWVESNEP